MTVVEPDQVPFYFPHTGWVYKGRAVSERRASGLCAKMGIPYRKPSDSDPDAYVFVLNTRIAGTFFVPGSDELVSAIPEGGELLMLREINPHDDLAIAISDGRGRKLGYIPRKDNAVIARLMDAGESFRCILSSKDSGEIRVDISMKRGKMVRRHFDSSFDSWGGPMCWIASAPVGRSMVGYQPMSDNTEEFDFEFELSEEDIWDLSWGHRSRSMDDRWEFFMEGRTMYICRSWTGFCLFEVSLGDDGTHRVRAESDPERYRASRDGKLSTLGNLFHDWTDPVTVVRGAAPYDVCGNVSICRGEGRFVIEGDGSVLLLRADQR